MNPDTLARMANDIARNFAALGHDNAVAATADHIASFWAPRMIADLAAAHHPALNSDAAAALARLVAGRVPESQTRATAPPSPRGGGSDAG